jgi:hypothetical protein
MASGEKLSFCIFEEEMSYIYTTLFFPEGQGESHPKNGCTQIITGQWVSPQ